MKTRCSRGRRNCIVASMVALLLQACGNVRIVGPGLGDNSNPYSGQDPKAFEVLDSSQVKFIDGLMAFGTGSTFGRFSPCGYGNLTGKPVPGSKFSKLEIGQSMQEVLMLAGYPDSQHVGLAKKQGFSLNRTDLREDYRLETSYTNVGRLVFAYVDPNYRQLTPGILNTTTKASCPGLRLKWVIYNRHEPAGPLESEGVHLRAYRGPPPEEGAQVASPPGMNEYGQVVDACKLERHPAQAADGSNAVAGEITGKAAANSKFNLLRLGMSRQKALDIVGAPTGTSKCGRAMFAGMGELEFSNAASGTERLTWIIHEAIDR